MSSALKNWARLFSVQRRTRHVRRDAAILLNYTKNWSKLNWGRDARVKYESGAARASAPEESCSCGYKKPWTHSTEETEEKVRTSIQTLKNIWRMVSTVVKFVHRFIVLIWTVVTSIYSAGAKVGSFFYFTKTAAQVVKMSVTSYVYYTSAKYTYNHGANLLSGVGSIEAIPNITLTTLF